MALKEWALVCDALDSGRQSILLRKGGLVEGQGFSFQFNEFYLFPTWFHEQLQKTTLPEGTDLPIREEGVVTIKIFAKLEWAKWVGDRETVEAMKDFHILREEVVNDRFTYDNRAGLYVALVRVYRLETPQSLVMDPTIHGGCRSWVEVPDYSSVGWKPVIRDDAHFACESRLLEIIG